MGWRQAKKLLDVGDRAPEVTLYDAEGRPQPMIELLSESAVLLAFYKASCPICQYTLPFVQRLYEQAIDRSVRIYAVSQDDAETAMRFAERHGLSFPFLLDNDDYGFEASNAFGLSTVPSMFLIAQDRQVTWASQGFQKRDLETLALQFGVTLFRPGENVPDSKAG